MLHGDLKPANLRRSDGIVRLIDHEHAQDIGKAEWASGTVDIILDELPCSTMTEAYSVGKTISRQMEDVPKENLRRPQHEKVWDSLHDVSLKLTDSNSEKRWSLNKARHAFQDMGTHIS